MSDTYALMRVLIESKPRRAAKRSEWRPPSTTQLDLEASLKRAIKRFIMSAKLSRDDVAMPDETAHDKLLDTITRCLEQAVHEGRQERGIISAAKNLAGRAVQLISDIVDSLSSKAHDIIETLFGSGDTEATIDDAVSELEQWAEGYSTGVAENEIQMAVTEAVLAAYRDEGETLLDVVREPDACDICIDIVGDGITVSIEDRERLPLFHFGCRCQANRHEE